MTKKLNQMSNHLEFFGYEVKIFEQGNDQEVGSLLAKHKSKNNFIIIEMNEFLCLVTVTFKTTIKEPSPERMAMLNKKNGEMSLLKAYTRKDDEGVLELRFFVPYIGDYNKQTFSYLIENVWRDLEMFVHENELFLRHV